MKRDPRWEDRVVSASDAVGLVGSNQNIFVHGAAMTPTPLVEALCARTDLSDVKLFHLHTSGPCPFAAPEHRRRLFSVSLFAGPSLRKPIAEGFADFMPVFLSDIPRMFSSGKIALDIALLQLSPPDRHGMCSLGTSVDTARAAADCAKIIIAEINDRVPRTHGHSRVPLNRVHTFIRTDRPIYAHDPTPPNEVESRIGEIIADLVEDGSTLQMGIGAIPDAVLSRLSGKHDLGVHSEMFSDGVIELMEHGVINNKQKRVFNGRTLTSFISGSRDLYDFVDDNLAVEFHPCDLTNDTHMIRQNPKVVAMNSAIEIDLTGQVCADSMGHRIYSGIGGQMDFIRGAALSEGGKPIIALPSTAKGGQVSRLVNNLRAGAGVVTTRGHVHWVVTEYGAVNLHGLTLRERGEALIKIAHPDFRPGLIREFRNTRHFTGSWPRIHEDEALS